jgi:hypothetical protein
MSEVDAAFGHSDDLTGLQPCHCLFGHVIAIRHDSGWAILTRGRAYGSATPMSSLAQITRRLATYIGSSPASSIRASQYNAALPWPPRMLFCNAEMRSYRASPVRSYDVAIDRFMESSNADSGVSGDASRMCSRRESAVRASPAASDAIEVMTWCVI